MAEITPNSELREIVTAAIENELAARGGGFLNAFVFMADYTDSEGLTTIYVGQMPGQVAYRSLGMSEYLSTWFRDDAVTAWEQAGLYGNHDDED